MNEQTNTMNEHINQAMERCMTWFMSRKHPFLMIILIGILIRFVMMPLTGQYDSDYWAVVVRNIQSGEGLYGLEGYYYSPVWGYTLGVLSVIQTSILNVSDLGTLVLIALPFPAMADAIITDFDAQFLNSFFPLTAKATNLVFAFSIDMMLFIIDLITAYVVYLWIMDCTNEKKKAMFGFGLVFLCPLIITTSSVDAMFDTFCALMFLLSMILIYKNHPFFAGMAMSLAILTKFFPIFICPIFLAYVIAKNKQSNSILKNVFLSFLGVLFAAALLLLPEIIDGNVADCFRFLTDRVDSTGESLLNVVGGYLRIITYIAITAISFIYSYLILKCKNEILNDCFIKYCFMMFVIMMVYPAPPRYLVLFVPLLAYYIALGYSKYCAGWMMISLGAILFVLAGNVTLLMGVSVYTGIISTETIVDLALCLFSGEYGYLFEIMYITATVVQYIGVILLLWAEYGQIIKDRMSKSEQNTDCE